MHSQRHGNRVQPESGGPACRRAASWTAALSKRSARAPASFSTPQASDNDSFFRKKHCDLLVTKKNETIDCSRESKEKSSLVCSDVGRIRCDCQPRFLSPCVYVQLATLRVGLVKTHLLVFTTLFTTLFCFLLRYLLRYGRRQRTTLMFFGTFQTPVQEEIGGKKPGLKVATYAPKTGVERV